MHGFDLKAEYPGFRLEARAEWKVGCVALFGASGAGKSSVLESLLGLRPEVRGSIVLCGDSLDGLSSHERRLGWVPQDPSLFVHMQVEENIHYAVRDASGKALAQRAIAALEIEPLLGRRVEELSGGEASRVALARALASNPRMLLLDEPLASIDRPLRARVVPFLRTLAEEGLPLLCVTHDPLEVLALAGWVFVIERGRIQQSGDPREVFASAADFGSLGALSAENRFPVDVVETRPGSWVVRTPAGMRLVMVRVEGFAEPTQVAIRAEDVMLMRGSPRAVSAQNVLRAVVIRVEPIGEQSLVHFETEDSEGDFWRVKVTSEAVRSLELSEGAVVELLIKAHAVLAV